MASPMKAIIPITLPPRNKGRPTNGRVEIEKRESARLISLGYDARGTNIPAELLPQISQDAIKDIDPSEFEMIRKPAPRRSPAGSREGSMSMDDLSLLGGRRPRRTVAYNPQTEAEDGDEEEGGVGSVKNEYQDDGDSDEGDTKDLTALSARRAKQLLKLQSQQKSSEKKYNENLAPKSGPIPIHHSISDRISQHHFAPHQRSTFKPSWPEQAGVDGGGKPVSKKTQKKAFQNKVTISWANQKAKVDEMALAEGEGGEGGGDDEEDEDNEDGAGAGAGGASKDKKKRRKIRHINIAPDPADRGFMPTPHDPELAKKLYSSILGKVKEFKNKDGKRLAEDWEELPDPEKDEEFYQKIERPTSFNAITARVQEGDYPTAADFQLDLSQLFINARRALTMGTPEYGDLVILQRYYQQLCTADLVLHQNNVEVAITAALAEADATRGYASMTVGPGHVQPGVDLENLTNRVTSSKKISYSEAYYQGIVLRPGDWCHIANPSDPRTPIIGHIFKVSRKEEDPAGQLWLSVCWYFRPEQTIHPPSTTFFRDEIFKTNRVGEHHVEDLIELAYAMFYTKYVKGRPTEGWWDVNKPTYIVEHRWNEDGKAFSKIKNWSSCVPEELRNKDIPIQNFPITLSYPERVPSPFLQGITGPGSLTGEQIPARAGTPENIRRANERAATLKKAQDAALLTGSGGSRGFLMMAVNAPARPSAQVDEPPAPVPEVVRATASPAPGTPFGAPMPIPINARGPSVPVPQVAPSTSVLSTLPKQPFTALTQDWKKGASASSLLSSLSGEVLKIVGISTYEQLRSYFEVPRPLDSPSLQEISDAIRVGDQRAAAMVPRPTLAGGIVSNPTPRNGGLVIDPDLLGRWRDALLSQNGFHPIPPFISQSHLEPQSLEAKRKVQDEKRIETRIGKVVKRTGGEGSVRYLPEETASLFQRDPSTSLVKWFPAPPLDGPYQQKLSKTYPNSVSYLPPSPTASPSHSLEYLYQVALRKKEQKERLEQEGNDAMDVDV